MKRIHIYPLGFLSLLFCFWMSACEPKRFFTGSSERIAQAIEKKCEADSLRTIITHKNLKIERLNLSIVDLSAELEETKAKLKLYEK